MLASCALKKTSEDLSLPPAISIELSGGALNNLQSDDGTTIETVSLDPELHGEAIGQIYDRLVASPRKSISPPEAVLSSEYLLLRFPDGRRFYMITSSFLEFEGQWFEGDFDKELVELIRYVHDNTELNWHSERLYSRFPPKHERERIREKWFARQFETTKANKAAFGAS